MIFGLLPCHVEHELWQQPTPTMSDASPLFLPSSHFATEQRRKFKKKRRKKEGNRQRKTRKEDLHHLLLKSPRKIAEGAVCILGCHLNPSKRERKRAQSRDWKRNIVCDNF